MYYTIFGPSDSQSKILIKMLNLNNYSLGRYRDIYLIENGKKIELITRNGGGNRHCDNSNTECYCMGCCQTVHLPKHPQWYKEGDCNFDYTYAFTHFNIPHDHVEECDKMWALNEIEKNKIEQEKVKEMEKEMEKQKIKEKELAQLQMVKDEEKRKNDEVRIQKSIEYKNEMLQLKKRRAELRLQSFKERKLIQDGNEKDPKFLHEKIEQFAKMQQIAKDEIETFQKKIEKHNNHIERLESKKLYYQSKLDLIVGK